MSSLDSLSAKPNYTVYGAIAMLNTTFALLILIPFILGFITYGIRKLMQPLAATVDPVTVKLSPEAMQQLREKGYLDPNTGKLKDSVVGLLNLEEAKS